MNTTANNFLSTKQIINFNAKTGDRIELDFCQQRTLAIVVDTFPNHITYKVLSNCKKVEGEFEHFASYETLIKQNAVFIKHSSNIKSGFLRKTLLLFQLQLVYLIIGECCIYIHFTYYKTSLWDRRNKASKLARIVFDQFLTVEPCEIISNSITPKKEVFDKFVVNLNKFAKAIALTVGQKLMNR